MDAPDSYEDLSDSIAELASKLDAKELIFANRIISGCKQYEAYHAVAPDVTFESAKVTSSRWMMREHVHNYIKEVKRQLAKRSLMSIEEIQDEVLRRAMADMTEFIGVERIQDDETGEESFVPIIKKTTDEMTPQERRLVKSVTMTKMGPKFEIADQRGYMDMFIKMIGGYAPERRELSGPDGSPIRHQVSDLTDEELEEQLKELGIDGES